MRCYQRESTLVARTKVFALISFDWQMVGEPIDPIRDWHLAIAVAECERIVT
jgi:hypothetical protein